MGKKKKTQRQKNIDKKFQSDYRIQQKWKKILAMWDEERVYRKENQVI